MFLCTLLATIVFRPNFGTDSGLGALFNWNGRVPATSCVAIGYRLGACNELCGGINEVPSVCCVIWRSISSFTSVCFSCSESCSSEFAKGIAARSTWHQTPINVLPMVNIFVKYRGFRLRLGTSAATNGAASRGYASFSTEESCSMIACCIRTEHLAASWLG